MLKSNIRFEISLLQQDETDTTLVCCNTAACLVMKFSRVSYVTLLYYLRVCNKTNSSFLL